MNRYSSYERENEHKVGISKNWRSYWRRDPYPTVNCKLKFGYYTYNYYLLEKQSNR